MGRPISLPADVGGRVGTHVHKRSTKIRTRFRSRFASNAIVSAAEVTVFHQAAHQVDHHLRTVTAMLDSRRLFLFVAAIGVFAMAVRGVVDPDVWWHLRTGQLILQNHHLFNSDPYSFTRFGQPWVNHEWLSDSLMYGL